MQRLRSWSVALVTIVVIGCASPAPAPTSEPAATRDAVDAPTPSRIRGGQDGLILEVELDRERVEPGGTVGIHVTVRNERDSPAIVAAGLCGAPAAVRFELPVPWQPAGREWDGIAGQFKRYALEQGFGPGGVPARDPIRVDVRSERCPDAGFELRVEPNESVTAELAWTAELVAGLPAPPGEVPVHVEVGYDRPDPIPVPKCDPICGSTVLTWKSFGVAGSVRIEGDSPPLLTAGEAVDALLSDPRFQAWLPQQAPRTWSGANLFLQSWPRAEGIVPAGPSWDIELFREVGVPRNWAIGFVDPLTGVVRNLEFCNSPCDR